jgi:hypothetical protein
MQMQQQQQHRLVALPLSALQLQDQDSQVGQVDKPQGRCNTQQRVQMY